MIDCPACGRAFPAVEGATEQTCPHCGHEFGTFLKGDLPRPPADPAAAAAAGFRIFVKRYPSFLLLWLPVLLVDVAVELSLQAYGNRVGLPTDLAQVDAATALRYLGVGVPLYLAFYAVQLAFFAVIAAHVLDHAAGEGGTATLRATLAKPGALLGLGLVLMLAYLGGLVLLIIGAVVFFHWYQFAPAALADRRRGVVDALQASRRFAKERRTFGFTALVLFVAFALAIVWAVLSAAGGAIFGGAPLARILVGALASWLLTPLVAILPAAYWAIAQHAPPPDPGAPQGPPAERFRTTKCPQCGTLVPYEASDGPVEVACPVCGRKGKVL